jgi:hypothetical protein
MRIASPWAEMIVDTGTADLDMVILCDKNGSRSETDRVRAPPIPGEVQTKHRPAGLRCRRANPRIDRPLFVCDATAHAGERAINVGIVDPHRDASTLILDTMGGGRPFIVSSHRRELI